MSQLPSIEPGRYPETKKEEVTDNYFGTDIVDPYRWLEDVKSEERNGGFLHLAEWRSCPWLLRLFLNQPKAFTSSMWH